MEKKPYELKPGNGSLFKNDEPHGENSPHYMGRLVIPPGMSGEVYISLWKRTAKSGKVYLSVSISEPKAKKPQPARAPVDNFEDDDMPF